MKLRRSLYRSARLLGDAGAIQHGRYSRRTVRNAAYRGLFRVPRRLFE